MPADTVFRPVSSSCQTLISQCCCFSSFILDDWRHSSARYHQRWWRLQAKWVKGQSNGAKIKKTCFEGNKLAVLCHRQEKGEKMAANDGNVKKVTDMVPRGKLSADRLKPHPGHFSVYANIYMLHENFWSVGNQWTFKFNRCDCTVVRKVFTLY